MGQAPLPPAPPHQELQLVDPETQLYLNTRSRRLYRRHSLLLADIADAHYELEVYTFRRLNEDYVVSVDYCSNSQGLEMCSSYAALTYFIEKQEYSLLQKHALPLREGIALLMHALQGFRILYERFGYFTPNSRLISFNHLHQPRVWISEDLKVTRNVQFPHGPKNATYEDSLVREVVRLFDALRDPSCPMAKYSHFLPNNLLSFQLAMDALLKKSVEMSCRKVQPLLEIINQRTDNSSQVTTRINHPISQHTSPYNSPPHHSPPHFRKENTPLLNFSYRSPPKTAMHSPVHLRDNSAETAEIKQATKLSLKNTVSKPCHLLQPSREFTSTMPNSIRNSGVFQRHVIIQKLDPTPTMSRKNSISNFNKEDNILKQAAQRYSEADQHVISFDNSRKTKALKVSLQDQAKMNFDRSNQVSHRASLAAEDEHSHSRLEEIGTKNQSGPFLIDAPRREFQSHKRHQTDFKLLAKMRESNDSSPNQISVDGNYLSKFNLNTIKSIHLLQEDRQLDREIIVDLKQIINKYRKMG